MPEYMISLRNADGSDGVGPARYLTFDDATVPPRQLAAQDWLNRIIASFPPVAGASPGNPNRTGEVLFFVHGFNVSGEAARNSHLNYVDRLAAAGWHGLLVSFDWPSDGLVFAYLADRANARAAASGLITSGVALLEAAQRLDCTITVHVMAHSMGAFVVQQAFTAAYQDVPPSWSIAQLIMAAADVDYSVFSAENYSAKMFGAHSGRLTAYCNFYDKALAASEAKRLELAPRMGRVGLPPDAPPFMCKVDCSDLFDEAYPDLADQLSPVTTHCFYFDRPEFWRDAVLTLAGGIDRSVIPTRSADATTTVPNRYTLTPGGISDAAYRLALARAATTPSIHP